MAQFRGIAFPFQKNQFAFPAAAEDDELIKQALVQLVLTGTGERVMRPDYGSGAYKYIFEENTDLLQHIVETDLYAVIGKYEPRVSVLSIDVVRGDQLEGSMGSENDQASIVISINYVVLSSKRAGSAVITLSTGG